MGRKKGFALITVLILTLVVFILGASAMYISEFAMKSLKSEALWQKVEKAADYGLLEFISRLKTGYVNCGETTTLTNINGATVTLKSIKGGASCLIWSKANIGTTSVVKVAIISTTSDTSLGAATIKNLTNLSMTGSAAIASCDPNCIIPALTTGNTLLSNPPENLVSQCPNNPKGLTALTDPYVPNAFDPNTTDLTPKVFNATDRNNLLSILSNLYKVAFSDGTPVGIIGNYVSVTDTNGNLKTDVVNATNPPAFDVCGSWFNTCTASGSSISCGNLTLSWTGTLYALKQGNTVYAYCSKIDLGPNSSLSINGFSGGSVIASNNVSFVGNLNGPVTLVARNSVSTPTNSVGIYSANIFGKNIYLQNANNINIYGGIIYSGGSGVGNLVIDLRANTQVGTSTDPVIIISDSNTNMANNGNANIYGLVFITSGSNNFNIGNNGNFKLQGMLVSNSLGNNNIDIKGNFEIYFNPTLISILSSRTFGLVKPPPCQGGYTNLNLFNILTKTLIY